MKVVHVSPTYYSIDSVVGGGEKYVIYVVKSLEESALRRSAVVENSVVVFGEQAERGVIGGIEYNKLCGRPWDPLSIRLGDLRNEFLGCDVVIVHQCLTAFGMFVASHARLEGKYVIGVDEAGGEHKLLGHTPEAARIFDLFLAYSRFNASSFTGLNVPVKIILGPVDTNFYTPAIGGERDPRLVLAVGRILPHKGFDRIMRALPAALRLVIAGSPTDEPYLDDLQRLKRSVGADVEICLGLDDDEIRTLMRRASLFVHASTHVDYRGTYYSKPELLGLAPLEALACGTPALVSAAGSLSELGSVHGCRVFSSDEELAELLGLHAEASVAAPDPAEIHAEVERLYGMAQFGDRLLAELTSGKR